MRNKDRMERRKGDWVSFMSGGRIVIGQIEYSRITITGWTEYVTTIGIVREDSVLETRSQALEQ